MRVIIYHPLARREYNRSLARIARRPATTHSVRDFIAEMEAAEQEILRGRGKVIRGGPPGYFRVGPTRKHKYSLVFKIAGPNQIHLLAVCHPSRMPFYWKNRKV